jgi:hypothetical protein
MSTASAAKAMLAAALADTPSVTSACLPLLLLLLLLLLLQTFQLDPEHEQGGEWYTGSITADARIARPHSEVAADAYGCGGLWERYNVSWDPEDEDEDDVHHAKGAGSGAEEQPQQGAAAAAAATADPASPAAAANADDDSWLSPWELYAAGQTTEAVLAAEHATQLTAEQVARLLHAVERLITGRSKYRLFRTAPPARAVYESSQGRQAYNRVIALPLGLDTIQVSCHIT